MKAIHCTKFLLATALTLLLAGGALAQDALKHTTLVPPDDSGSCTGSHGGTLTFQAIPADVPFSCPAPGTDIQTLKSIALASTATSADPDVLSGCTYTMDLVITDLGSGAVQHVAVSGSFTGSFSFTTSNTHHSATATPSSFDLGCHHYDLGGFIYVPPDPPSADPPNLGSVAVHITCSARVCTPTITNCPQGSDLGCNPTELPTCDSVKALVTFNDTCPGAHLTCDQADSDSGCTHTRTFTITATDDCGATSSPCVVTYTWTVDTTPPTIDTCPPGGDLGCNPQTLPTCDSVKSQVGASDNCPGTPTLTCVDGGVIPDGCSRSETFTITAKDACGNESQPCVVTYTWTEDTTPPTIDTCPQGADLSCNPKTIPSCDTILPGVTFHDNCPGTLTPHCTAGDLISNGCSRSQTFTITVEDACHNVSAPCTVTYTWKEDTTAPVLHGCLPEGTIIEVPGSACGGTGTVTLPNVTATDDCDPEVSVSCLRSDGLLCSDPYPCGDTTVTFEALDSCLNRSTCSVIVRVDCGCGATRTQGFWATYLKAVQAFIECICAPGNTCVPCTVAEVEAIFWAKIGTRCDGTKRSALGQARLQLGQQILAAQLNCCVLGPCGGRCPDGGQATIDSWWNTLCTGTTAQIKALIPIVTAFNESGDNVPFSNCETALSGPATPTAAKKAAAGYPCPDPGAFFN